MLKLLILGCCCRRYGLRTAGIIVEVVQPKVIPGIILVQQLLFLLLFLHTDIELLGNFYFWFNIFTSILIQRMCIIQQHTIIAKGIFDPIVINYFKKLPFIGYGSKGSIRHNSYFKVGLN